MKILVISLAGIGDTLLATPLIHELRLHHPAAELDALVMWRGSRDILEGNPHLNAIHHKAMLQDGLASSLKFLWGLRRRRYDVSLNTYPQGKIQYRAIARLIGAPIRASHRYENHRFPDDWLVNRSIPQDYQRHSVDNNLALLPLIGVRPQLAEHRTEIFLAPADTQWADTFVRDHTLSGRTLLGLHIGSGKTKNLALRRWPVANYIELIHRLTAARPQLTVLLFGGPEEREDHSAILAATAGRPVLAPDTKNLKQAAALLGHCAAFLSIDSAVMHLAAVMNVPHQFVIETMTFNPTITPHGRPYHMIPNPAVNGRSLEFYRYDGRDIRGSDAELEQCMQAVTVDSVVTAMLPVL